MNPKSLRESRLKRGWSQPTAAHRLGVSQSYLAMLETGHRRVTSSLARRFVRVYHLTSSALLPTRDFNPHAGLDAQGFANQLSVLGYPGFAYLRSRVARMNPGEVLLAALAQDELDPRLVEALPWLVLEYWDMDTGWLVEEACRFTLQNSLGFVVSLARRLSEAKQSPNPNRTMTLTMREEQLYGKRLARESTFLRDLRTDAEKVWVMQNRGEDAKRWNLLTDWRPEHFSYGP
jgi:transcriptional regulator with XRE-family HTH domain